MVVELVQTSLQDRFLAEEVTWQAVVLIPKGGGEYHGIGIVDVVWKAVAVILNCRFTASTTYQDSPHGFWAGCGTGTAKLEVKLIQKVTATRKKSPSRGISGPAQGVQRLGQVQVPGDPGGIWCGAQGPPPPPQVLG